MPSALRAAVKRGGARLRPRLFNLQPIRRESRFRCCSLTVTRFKVLYTKLSQMKTVLPRCTTMAGNQAERCSGCLRSARLWVHTQRRTDGSNFFRTFHLKFAPVIPVLCGNCPLPCIRAVRLSGMQPTCCHFCAALYGQSSVGVSENTFARANCCLPYVVWQKNLLVLTAG